MRWIRLDKKKCVCHNINCARIYGSILFFFYSSKVNGIKKKKKNKIIKKLHSDSIIFCMIGIEIAFIMIVLETTTIINHCVPTFN